MRLRLSWLQDGTGAAIFINPMCGSGTLAIEAALAGTNRASGILRDYFAFMHLKGFNESLWKDLRAQAKKEAKKTLDCRIIATDIRRDAVEQQGGMLLLPGLST